jgi:hypothetical protein
MPIIEDIQVISASIESIISGRPKLFRTTNDEIAVAVQGVLMPYNIYLNCIIDNIYGRKCSTLNNLVDDELAIKMKNLYRGVKVPSKHEEMFKQAPWLAAIEAIYQMLSEIRESKDFQPSDIIEMLREVEEDYARLYVPKNIPYHDNFTKNIRWMTPRLPVINKECAILK